MHCSTIIMALGFGFNKTKVLATAEKFMQQGKLQNAIAEYLKVTQADPKDLTVINTVGDLYVRLGQTSDGVSCFKQVGETYANEGFTVKAIAIYKKLVKLSPGNNDFILKLAELYAQQGLYNDARAQYLSIADHCLRSGDNQQASRIFRKMLELDPENTAMQSKLADLYIKLGNKEEARNIFFTAAQSLFRRGAMEPADEALGRVLALDPTHVEAAMLRGQIAAETGNAEQAIQYFEKVPNLDSQPDALRALLRVHLQTDNMSEAMPVATKLLNVHNDISGVIACADHLLAAGEHEAGLRLYDQYTERLLAHDSDKVLAKLASVPAHLNSNPAALELVIKLYRKAGDTTHLTEVMELLAHALVQAGELNRARDLYNQLAALEPDNAAHLQNYKQVSARLGDDAANRPLTADEGAQALMVDELEIDAPPIHQEYPPEVERKIRGAITDSELLDSYNMAAKAIAPLEAALRDAPNHVLLNQRLASLYARAERYSDAARCCDVLHDAYRSAGHKELASQYAEMSAKYHQRAGEPIPEYSPAAADAEQSTEPPVAPVESIQTEAADAWEAMTSVEPPDQVAAVHAGPKKSAKAGDVVGDLLEEIRFYISQGMWEEAEAGIERCEALASGIPELAELQEHLERSRRGTADTPDVEVIEDASTAEPTVNALILDGETIGAEQEPQVPELEPAVSHYAAPQSHQPETAPLPLAAASPAIDPRETLTEIRQAQPVQGHKANDPLAEIVLDIEEKLGADFAVAPPEPQVATPHAASASAAGAGTPPNCGQKAPAAAPRPIPPKPVSVPVVPASAATIVPARHSLAARSPDETDSALEGIFGEFKNEMETEGAITGDQDPETHYNLGVAFKEMGLLEEAIGEFQKVCRAIDHGQPFTHLLEVYTWLAECLMDKGAPQAAIKWYQRALQLPAVGEEIRIAVYYEMAGAYETAGNRQAALDNFMEVYANNIDYRDVAERIKTLKA
jgi:tetratricopeptide (TPR) repeat protein